MLSKGRGNFSREQSKLNFMNLSCFYVLQTAKKKKKKRELALPSQKSVMCYCVMRASGSNYDEMGRSGVVVT